MVAPARETDSRSSVASGGYFLSKDGPSKPVFRLEVFDLQFGANHWNRIEFSCQAINGTAVGPRDGIEAVVNHQHAGESRLAGSALITVT